jgi:glycosyltransferase involved in cell wall biosynthesis
MSGSTGNGFGIGAMSSINFTSYIAPPAAPLARIEPAAAAPAPAPEEPLLSIVVPCYNEQPAIERTVHDLRRCADAIEGCEIILVDDGSRDGTTETLRRLARTFPELQVIEHARNRGYGAALKTGIRQARGRFIAITDADGSYPNERIPELVARCGEADMVVGARTGEAVAHSRLRAVPKAVMRWYCVWLTRQPVPDMNSGLRVFRREVAARFLNVLPDSFSFTTTITIALMINGYAVRYVPISYARRIGRSKIAPVADTIRFLQLILRTAVYFAPLRVLWPLIALLWTGFAAAFAYDVWQIGNLSDKTVILLMFATQISLLALIADMFDKRLQ